MKKKKKKQPLNHHIFIQPHQGQLLDVFFLERISTYDVRS